MDPAEISDSIEELAHGAPICVHLLRAIGEADVFDEEDFWQRKYVTYSNKNATRVQHVIGTLLMKKLLTRNPSRGNSYFVARKLQRALKDVKLSTPPSSIPLITATG